MRVISYVHLDLHAVVARDHETLQRMSVAGEGKKLHDHVDAVDATWLAMKNLGRCLQKGVCVYMIISKAGTYPTIRLGGCGHTR